MMDNDTTMSDGNADIKQSSHMHERSLQRPFHFDNHMLVGRFHFEIYTHFTKSILEKLPTPSIFHVLKDVKTKSDPMFFFLINQNFL
jgi:hypothetical protein